MRLNLINLSLKLTIGTSQANSWIILNHLLDSIIKHLEMIVIIIALRDLLKWIVKKKLNFHAALSKEVVENRGSPILLGASRVAI